MSPATRTAGTEENHDLIIAGGGIHGLVLALMAAEQGLRPIVFDSGQPGKATSAAWFGILHGGLRYLQTLDVGRLRESVRARRWFMQRFPDLMRPLPFLMPLYDQGLKRAEVFRLAFLMDAALTIDRNLGVPPALRLSAGQVQSTRDVEEQFPEVRRSDLRSGARWYEVVALDSEALMAELIAKAVAAGVEIRAGARVTGALHDAGNIAGVTVEDQSTGQHTSHLSARVVNAAGPWSGTLARRLDPGAPALFHPALGFNLMLDRPPPSEIGLSLSPPEKGGAMLFVYPKDGKTFAGTWYAARDDASAARGDISPSDREIADFLAALNACVPGFAVEPRHVIGISAGLLPARAAGSTDLASSDAVLDHGRHGGPAGLYSLAGIKYTTAPEVARKLLKLIGRTGR